VSVTRGGSAEDGEAGGAEGGDEFGTVVGAAGFQVQRHLRLAERRPANEAPLQLTSEPNW